MKKLGTNIFGLAICSLMLLACAEKLVAQNDIEGLNVEVYYISDASDATDVDGGNLAAGSVVYRVFLDLDNGVKLRSIYGDANHHLEVSSTAVFFNNVDRGEVYGFDIGDNNLDENTVALDSWFTFGLASESHYGVLKIDDTDGSVVGGVNNDGGSESLSGGLLVNQDISAGIPITQQDGLLPFTGIFPGITEVGNSPGAAFDNLNAASTFSSDNTTLFLPSGMSGYGEENMILVAQFTTNGELSFLLNVEVIRENGDMVKYVSTGEVLLEGEILSPWLKYPGVCGCLDPDFLEYNPSASCDDGSCQTLVVLGCMDTLACNYDPFANFNVQELCCILPDNCDGLDPNLICEGFVGIDSFNHGEELLQVFPNPFDEKLKLVFTDSGMENCLVHFYDISGRELNVPVYKTDFGLELNTDSLPCGSYILGIVSGNAVIFTKLLKGK